MASTLQTMQAMSQATALANKAQAAVETQEPDEDPAANVPWYMACCAADEFENEKSLEELAAEKALGSKTRKLTLRVNVFSGHDIAEYPTYLSVEVQDALRSHQEFSGEEPASRTPVWGSSFELPLSFSPGNSLEARVTVWGKSQVHGRLDWQMGTATIRVPCSPTDWPVLMDVPLGHVAAPGPFSSALKSTLRVAYEVLEGHASNGKLLEGVSDLLHIATMGDAGKIKTQWNISATLHNLTLYGLHEGQTLIHEVRLRIVKRQRQQGKKHREVVGHSISTGSVSAATDDSGVLRADLVSDKKDERGAPLPWGIDKEPWQMTATRAQLNGYVLEVAVLQVEPGGDSHDHDSKTVTVGLWEETLGNMLDNIRDFGCKVRLKALLSKPGHAPLASTVELGVDIWDLSQHRDIPPIFDVKPRSGRSIALQSRQQMMYFVLWLDRFVPAHGQSPDPVLRLTVGSQTVLARVDEDASTPDRFAFEPVGVLTEPSGIRLRLELYNRPSAIGMSSVDEFVGQVVLRDLVRKEVYWREIYAGSHLGKYAVVSNLMGKGVKRASTFRGLVAVSLLNTPTITHEFYAKSFEAAYQPVNVKVRLYQGLYLRRLRSTKVKVVFCVGGCDNIVDNVSRVRSRSLFVFPGMVNEHGTLSFYAGNGMRNRGEAEYVEESTTGPIILPPDGPIHGYLYVCKDGVDETSEAPEIWGRVRLAKSFDDSRWTSPAWKTMRVDVSAADLEPSDFDNTFAGCILAKAVMFTGEEKDSAEKPTPAPVIATTPSAEALPQPPPPQKPSQQAIAADSEEGNGNWVPPSQPALDTVKVLVEEDAQEFIGASGWCGAMSPSILKHTPKVAIKARDGNAPKPMFCHIDLLAARRLLPLGAINDCKISFRLQACNTVVDVDGIEQSPNPGLTCRYELKVDDWTLAGLPVPPVQIFVRKVIASTFGKREEVVCCFGIKTRNMDQITSTSNKYTNPNEAHVATWRSLDGRYKQQFNPADNGSVSEFWKGRPRMLVAAGFSVNPADPATVLPADKEHDGIPKIATPESRQYQVELSLLGLRDLKDHVGEPLMSPDCYLQIKTWSDDPKTTCRLELLEPGRPSELPNPTFRTAKVSKKYGEIETKVANMYDSLLGAGGHESAVQYFLGQRMTLPTYSCPVIPYLQIRGQAGAPANGDVDCIVLLNDVLFQVMHPDGVKAAASVPLPLSTLAKSDMDPPKWSERAANRFSQDSIVPQIESIEPEQEQDPVFSFAVDVFACTDGYLLFDPDVQVGRPLARNTLFRIWQVEPSDQGTMSKEEREEEVANMKAQTFNPADTSSAKLRTKIGPNDSRFIPILRNAKWTSKGGWVSSPVTALSTKAEEGSTTLSLKEARKEWKGKRIQIILPSGARHAYSVVSNSAKVLTVEPPLQRSYDAGWEVRICARSRDMRMPLRPEMLFRQVTSKGVAKLASIEKARLMDLKAHCLKRGYHVSTRLAAPDPVNPRKETGAQKSHRKECNSHTFLRDVGHVVKPWERQTTVLARLCMGPGRDVSPQGQTHSFLVVKCNKPAVVVWAPSEAKSEFKHPGELLFIVRLLDDTERLVEVTVPSFDIRFNNETTWVLKKTLASDMGRVNRKILPEVVQQKARIKAPEPQVIGKRADKTIPAVNDDSEGEDENGEDSGDESVGDENVQEAANEPIDKNAWKYNSNTDGYTHGIPIAQWAFVCRFEKKGLNIYNRRQTDNYYRATLDCFQEYSTFLLEDPDPREADTPCYKRAEDPKKDLEKLRLFSLSQTLNLRRPLEAVGDGVDGMIKGHITVRQLSPEADAPGDDQDGGGAEAQAGPQRRPAGGGWFGMKDKKPSHALQSLPVTCPISNMWAASEVRVVVRIFAIYDMTPTDEQLDPYITLNLSCPGGEDVVKRCDELSPVAPGSDFMSVYWETEIVTTLPGSGNLAIKLWRKASAVSGVFGGKDTELGSLVLDLEDRQLALAQREFRIGTNQHRLNGLVSPPKSISVVRPSPADLLAGEQEEKVFKAELKRKEKAKGLRMNIQPRRSPNPAAPIEYRDLTVVQAPGCPEEKTGTLKFCTEIMDAKELYQPLKLTRALKRVHIKISVKEVDNIDVFRDTGLRNDVRIKGDLVARNWFGYQLPLQSRATDTHKWAHRRATFDFVWHFVVDYPIGAASLKVSMVNVSTFRGETQIYRPEVFPMDALLSAFSAGPDNVSFGENIVFTAWPDGYPEHAKYINGMGCFRLACYRLGKCLCCCIPGCCRRNANVPRPKPAKLSLMISMAKVADDYVLESEVEKPPEEPEGRVNWRTGLSSPGTLAKAVIGRANMDSCTYLMGTLCCIICVLIIIVVLYFLFTLINQYESN